MSSDHRFRRNHLVFAGTVMLVLTGGISVSLAIQERSPARSHSTLRTIEDSALRTSGQDYVRPNSQRLDSKPPSSILQGSAGQGSAGQDSSRREGASRSSSSSRVRDAALHRWGKPRSAMIVRPVAYHQPIPQEADASSLVEIPFKRIEPRQQTINQLQHNQLQHNQGSAQPTIQQRQQFHIENPPQATAHRYSTANSPTPLQGTTRGASAYTHPPAGVPTGTSSGFGHIQQGADEPEIRYKDTFENRHDEALATANPQGRPSRFTDRIGPGLRGRYTAHDRQPTATEKLIMRDAEIRLLRSQLSKLRSENVTLRSELKLTVDVLNRTHIALSESESQIISLTNENNGLKDGFRALTIEFSKSETEVERLLKQLRTLVNQELSDQSRFDAGMNSDPGSSSLRGLNPAEQRRIDPNLNDREMIKGPVPGTEMLPSPK